MQTPQQRIDALIAKQLPQGNQATEKEDRSKTELTERNVNMSNALARSAQGLNLTQKRIVALALAKTDSLPDRNLFEGTRIGWAISLSAKDYAKAYEITTDDAYEQLQDGARSMAKTLWRIEETTTRGLSITEGAWVSWIQYIKGEGEINIVFNPKVTPHLLGLKTKFTTYKLRHAVALKSIYAWRLFECLMSYKATRTWHVSVEEFKKIMEMPKAYENDFGQVKKEIAKAIKRIAKTQKMKITLDTEKRGTRVKNLVFKFELPQQPIDFDQEAKQ